MDRVSDGVRLTRRRSPRGGLRAGRGSRGAWRARADRGRTGVLAPIRPPRHASTISRSASGRRCPRSRGAGLARARACWSGCRARRCTRPEGWWGSRSAEPTGSASRNGPLAGRRTRRRRVLMGIPAAPAAMPGGIRPGAQNPPRVVVLGIDPGLANCGFGVVAAPRRARGRARRRRDRRRAPGVAPERRLAELFTAHRRAARSARARRASRSRTSTSARTCARRSPSARRAASSLLRRRPARHPCFDYTPQQVKGAVCGSGRADKEQVQRMVAGAARRCPSRRRPTTPPTRSPSRSATSTTRRCAAAPRPPTWRATGDRARRAARSPSAARDHVVIETAGGVGYRLAVSAETLRQVPAVGRPVSLHAHLVVRDDTMPLYGFATEEERDLFLHADSASRASARRSRSRSSRGGTAARAAAARSPPATRSASRPCPGSASGPRSGSSSSCARRSRRRLDGAEPRDRRHAAATTRARWPATACSSSATRPPRPTRCSPSPRARAPRTLLAERAAQAREAHERSARRSREAARSRRRGALAGEDELDRSLRPRTARRLRRPGAGDRAARGLHRGGAPRAASRSTTCCSPARPASARPRSRRSSPPSSTRRSCRPPGPALERKGDIAAFLTALEPRRRLLRRRDPPPQPRARGDASTRRWRTGGCRSCSARAPGARVVTLDLPPFTLIGATTRAGLLTTPLRDRFGIQHRLEHYDARRPRARSSRRSAEHPRRRDRRRAARARSPRARRGTPRVANRLLQAACATSPRCAATGVDRRDDVADEALDAARGRRTRASTASTARSSRAICDEVRAAARSGSRRSRSRSARRPDTIEDVYEPYLLQRGLLKRTPRGRVATARAYEHLGLEPPRRAGRCSER